MRKNICELIRRELDELTLDETSSSAAVEHLRECDACREFYEKQTRLRQIVGSLGTVSAPADFDFRLRARLANESGSAASHFNFVAWPALRRGFVAAVLLLVFATGAFVVRNILNGPASVDEMAKQRPAPQVQETRRSQEKASPQIPDAPKQNDVMVAADKHPQGNKMERPVQVAIKNKRPLATMELSSLGAEVVKGVEPVGEPAAFPIDASLQSFRVSLDDGRGNARTISVPTISFGSQRLMQNANQVAPKRVW